jgi:membrane protein DedA with SNARE-associated domain
MTEVSCIVLGAATIVAVFCAGKHETITGMVLIGSGAAMVVGNAILYAVGVGS